MKKMIFVFSICFVCLLLASCTANCDHQWKKQLCGEPVRCELCDFEFENSLSSSEHTPGIPDSCTDDITCLLCDTFMAEAPGHQWVEGNCYSAKYCSVCCLETGDPVHQLAEATCEEGECCTECGKEFGEPLGHRDVSTVCSKYPTYFKNGVFDSVCGICGKTFNSTESSFNVAYGADWIQNPVHQGKLWFSADEYRRGFMRHFGDDTQIKFAKSQDAVLLVSQNNEAAATVYFYNDGERVQLSQSLDVGIDKLEIYIPRNRTGTTSYALGATRASIIYCDFTMFLDDEDNRYGKADEILQELIDLYNNSDEDTKVVSLVNNGIQYSFEAYMDNDGLTWMVITAEPAG